MRPIKLTISAFGPYADEQTINFEELNGRNIFVISGKTGAGKTTIFDAISYSLYGEASGESREIDSLRSHFADDNSETFVELEFELKGERYIIYRCPKQKKKKSRGEGYTEKSAEAKLTLSNGKLITGVKDVTNKIVELLGINRNQFKQIVMLAQGEFKKLLLADSKDREAIFRKIFNTYDFEKIQKQLEEKAKTLRQDRSKRKDEIETNLKNIKGEHDINIGEYVDFPFVIEKLKEFISNDNEVYKNLQITCENLDQKLEFKNKEKVKIENNNQLLKEKENVEKKLVELLDIEKEFELKKQTINKCKSAKEVKYIEDKLIENKSNLEQREKTYKNTLLNIEKLTEKSNIVTVNLKEEESKDYERDLLKLEINKLQSIKPKIEEFDKLKSNLVIKNKSIDEIKSKIEKNRLINENLKKEKLENENKIKEISVLEIKRVELENDKSNKEKFRLELRELYNIILTYQNYKDNHNKLKIEYELFEKEYKTIKQNYEKMDELYKKEQAGILAYNLKENTPCPVCGSKIHPSPASISRELKVPTKEELKIAKESLDEVEKSNNLKIAQLSTLKTECESKFENLNNILHKLSENLNIDKNYSVNTIKQVKSKGIELKNNIEALEKELNQIDEKIKLKNSIDEKNINIEKNIESIEKELVKLEDNEKILLPEIAQINTKINEYKKEIPDNILDVTTLESLITIKSKELVNSQNKLNKLREENENILKQLEGETYKSNEIKKSIEEVKNSVEEIKLEFDNLLKNFGFIDSNDYNQFKSKIYLIEKLEEEVKNYDYDLNLFKSKQEDIIIKTKDLHFIDINNIDEKIKKLQQEKKTLELKIRESYSILENNKSILQNVEKLNAKFKAIEEEYMVVGELADLANGKKSPYISFERYILASYFEDIIEAANIRLEKMTGDRFSLIRKKSKSKGAGQKGLELEIYDNYTDSARDVSSLSGGESFKASLSLALGLSDVVQSNAGGVSLDTMFVDEGFGTLDPQSLDSAIDSLLELQRGGRLVGIISHVEELKERIDAKLEVISTSKGSKAKFNIL